jgi:Tfp pilus assembly pilus retraction ATPase PilT
MDASPTSIDDLLARAVEAQASDLNVVPGTPPAVRVHGEISHVEGAERLKPDATPVSRSHPLDRPEKTARGRPQLDFSYGVPVSGASA